MKRNLGLILIPVLVTVICGTLSFLAGHYVAWTPLGTPPEPAVEIVSADRGNVIVRTATGSFYQCSDSSPYSIASGCTWERIETAPMEPEVPEGDEGCLYLLPPGRVADHLYFCRNSDWRYVVLTNGSVWMLLADDGEITVDDYPALFIRVALIYLGPVVSLFLGFATFHFLWRRRPRQG